MSASNTLKIAVLASVGLALVAGYGEAPAQVASTTDTAIINGATVAEDEVAIRDLLSGYQAALNASDTDAVMQLYTEQGVFMAPGNRSAVGADALRAAYDAVFNAINLDVEFDVVEVVRMSPQWAYARTNSAGTTLVNATQQSGPEANQELFILRKGDDGQWKIARYAFSSTNPPRQ